MSNSMLRCWCIALIGLSLALLTATVQAQVEKDATTDEAKGQSAQVEALRKELAAKQKQLDLALEANRDYSEQLKPLREKQQYERDLEQLKDKSHFGQSQLGPAEARIYAELSKPTIVEFIDTPLADVVDYLKDAHRIEIQIDQMVLDDAGIGSDTPVTKNLRGVTLRSALAIILRELDLTSVVDNEVLMITTNDVAQRRLDSRVYDVRHLLSEGEQPDSRAANELAAVLDFVLQKPDPVYSNPAVARPANGNPDVGSLAKAIAFRHLLVVRATQQGHREIEVLLKEIAGASSPQKP